MFGGQFGPSPTNAQIEQQITPSAGLNFPLEVSGQQYSPAIVERPSDLQESLRQQYAPEVARTDVDELVEEIAHEEPIITENKKPQLKTLI